MTAIANTNNLRLYTIRISLILEQILAFASSSNLVREDKNKSPNFKQISRRCFELLNVLIQIDRPILSLNFSQFHLVIYSGNLCIVDITSYSL